MGAFEAELPECDGVLAGHFEQAADGADVIEDAGADGAGGELAALGAGEELVEPLLRGDGEQPAVLAGDLDGGAPAGGAASDEEIPGEAVGKGGGDGAKGGGSAGGAYLILCDEMPGRGGQEAAHAGGPAGLPVRRDLVEEQVEAGLVVERGVARHADRSGFNTDHLECARGELDEVIGGCVASGGGCGRARIHDVEGRKTGADRGQAGGAGATTYTAHGF
jgi:hypothetical protein